MKDYIFPRQAIAKIFLSHIPHTRPKFLCQVFQEFSFDLFKFCLQWLFSQNFQQILFSKGSVISITVSYVR